MTRWWVVGLACVLATGCTRSNMDSQPKYYEYRPADLFGNGRVMQQPVAGTVARDQDEWDAGVAHKPGVTAALLSRGRERFDIFCSPCHDRTGSGDGMVVRRGMPRPPSFHDDRLRQAGDQHFFDVISNGFGAMYAYGDRIEPHDRWAIVAYIRALQLSQNATPNDLSADERASLGAQATQ